MPLPQVSDRIKELPGQALRAVFTGVGQLLLAADKVRAQLATPPDEPAQRAAVPSPEPVAPPAAAPQTAAAAGTDTPAGSSVLPPEVTDPAESRWRSLDKTGNVRVLPDGDPDLGTAASAPPATAAEPAAAVAQPGPADLAVPAPAEVAEPEPAEVVPAEPILAATPEPAEVTPTAGPATAALPLVGYDQLSVASLRARLRVLDVSQVRTLLDYEKTNQNRADVVTMFERRIAKLEQGG